MEKGGAFWLGDLICAAQKEMDITYEEPQFWQLNTNLEEKTAEVICHNGNDGEEEGSYEKVYYTHHIPYTNFPHKTQKLYLMWADDKAKVLMLPSEY